MKRTGERGLTLVELVVALALCSVLLAILADVLGNWHNHRLQVLAENELTVNLNYALGELAHDLQQAVWVEPQAAAGQLTLYLANGDKIGYTLADDPMSDEHPYALQGQVLYREANDGKRQPIANFLSQMTVGYEMCGEMVTAVNVRLSGQALTKTVAAERTLTVGGYYWRWEKMEISR